MNARQIMTRPVVTVTPQTSVRDAVRLMLEHRISGLPVIDDAGILVGIVTEADVLLKEATPRPAPPFLDWVGRWLWLERWLGAYRKAEGRIVAAVMTHNVITASEETTAHELASTMLRHQVNRLPVVRDRKPVGIVTRADILRLFLRSDRALFEEAKRSVKQFTVFGEEIQVAVDCGVIFVQGRVADRSRRAALLHRLEEIDGAVAIDAEELTHAYSETVRIE